MVTFNCLCQKYTLKEIYIRAHANKLYLPVDWNGMIPSYVYVVEAAGGPADLPSVVYQRDVLHGDFD